MPSVISLITLLSCVIGLVIAETHRITITNNCGSGTPKLGDGNGILFEGDGEYVHEGMLESGSAWLPDDRCPDPINGAGCSLLEFTLTQDLGNGDISLIPPNVFTDPVGFEFIDACAGLGASCGEDGCNTAYYEFNDDCSIQCSESGVGVKLTFCGVSTGFTSNDERHQESPCVGRSDSGSSSAANSTSAGETASDSASASNSASDGAAGDSTSAGAATQTADGTE